MTFESYKKKWGFLGDDIIRFPSNETVPGHYSERYIDFKSACSHDKVEEYDHTYTEGEKPPYSFIGFAATWLTVSWILERLIG